MSAMSKLIYPETVGGIDYIRVLTCVNGVEGTVAKTRPGVGKPFWVWATIPTGQIIAVDMEDAPIATASAAVNTQLVAAITATAEEKLTYA
jgi:hypothetical protein